MKKLTDYVSNQLLKEAAARVHEKIQGDKLLMDLTAQLLRILYDEEDEEGFLAHEKKHRGYIEDVLGKDADCFLFVVFDMGFDRLVDIYAKRGIPEEIMAATMVDFDTKADDYCEEFKAVGVIGYEWLVLHMRGWLFQIGRLQYVMYATFGNSHVLANNKSELAVVVAKEGLMIDKDGLIVEEAPNFITVFEEADSDITANPVNEIGNTLPTPITISKAEYKYTLKSGSPILEMHIPAQGRLDREDCIDSMTNAIEFAKTYFPDIDYKGFTISCWLLSEELKELLNENSNIIKFSNLFYRAATYGGASGGLGHTYKRVFGYDKDIKDYKSHTPVSTLQKGIHKLLDEGRINIPRKGFILIENGKLRLSGGRES
ncbi:MAG: acyltransferase domain-containing protein [Defluviitaleaceae bacterium]|nr:acyltransferase domain-containing protein [Defluviitaleaceae bacterium]